jgi:hypothetical protein
MVTRLAVNSVVPAEIVIVVADASAARSLVMSLAAVLYRLGGVWRSG